MPPTLPTLVLPTPEVNTSGPNATTREAASRQEGAMIRGVRVDLLDESTKETLAQRLAQRREAGVRRRLQLR